MGKKDGPRRQRRVPGGAPQRVYVRVTTQVHQELVWRAKLVGLSVPRYLVECGLRHQDGGSLHDRRLWLEHAETAQARLGRVGGLLNQLAAGMHSGRPPTDPQLTAALAYVQETATLLRAALLTSR
ncbi:plasmid mobilization protein [Actinokineospora sp. 24-640]